MPVYKLKLGDGGNPPIYKARIVVKGFQQKKGVNFDEIFAPVVKMTSIRRRGKLDPKTRPCIFLGYGDDEFGYRVWD